MTDIEMIKRCAEVMGYQHITFSPLARPGIAPGKVSISKTGTSVDEEYDPFTNDAQAMELLKKFPMNVEHPAITDGEHWHVESVAIVNGFCAWIADKDLNRAIVECVAQMGEAE